MTKDIGLIENKDELAQLLRETRESMGVSLDQVSKDLKIRKAYVEAIESSDYSVIPSLVYVHGYVQMYKAYLQLDINVIADIADDVDDETAFEISRHTKSSVASGFEKPVQAGNGILAYIILAVIISTMYLLIVS